MAISKNLTDIHCHILPGIDDGAKDPDMSGALLLSEKHQGIGQIIFTPHYYADEISVEGYIKRRQDALDRMQEIESRINQDPELIISDKLLQVKERYTKSFFRCCNELCLSPQSRAKMGNLNLQAKEENPLLKVLSDDE